MNESMRDLLREGAETVERPDLDVGHLVAQAEGRMRRRRFAAVATAAVAVGAITAGGLALTPGDQKLTPPPPSDTVTPPPPAADGSIYFAADSTAGPSLTEPVWFGKVEIDPQDMDIYLSRTGQPLRRVIATKAHERCPAVSPDGDHLAYLADATIVIAALDAEGNPGHIEARVDLDPERLQRPDGYQPRNSAGPACPQWSPDGSRLGYVISLDDMDPEVFGDPGTGEIHAVTPDGKDRVLTSFDARQWPYFAWSPDGDAVAYTTRAGVWRAPLDGGAPELVWRTPFGDPPLVPDPFVDMGDQLLSLSWSSRDELAFSWLAHDERNWMHTTLVVVDAGSGDVRFETGAGSTLEGGAGEQWSPDGSQLLYAGRDDRVHVYDLATGSTSALPLRIDGTAGGFAPIWSPDGRHVLARGRSDDRGFALVSFDLDGSSSQVRTPWTWALDWASLDDVEWASPGLGEG